MAADRDHLRKVVTTAEEHERRLLAALTTLESRMVQLLREAPLRDGSLFNLEWAITARQSIREIIASEYSGILDQIVDDYEEIARDAAAMLGKYSDFIRLDPTVVRQLQQLSFDGYNSLGDEFLESVSRQIYDATLTGQTFADSVRIVAQSVDQDLARYARQAVFDGLMDFDAVLNTRMGLDAGAERFVYIGPDDAKTRPHCEKHVGKTLTIDEINDAWSGSWAGKREGSPFVVRGGYNCRHRFRPVFN